MRGPFGKLLLAGAAVALLAGCQDSGGLSNAKAYQAISKDTLDLMASKGTNRGAPVLIRTYKKEAELEVWKMKADGRYVHIKTFPMCRWSGQLGPKVREGDRQVPEGFYAITPGQMNPNSAYYLSFNVGYPNAFDRAHNFTGGLIMVHGACSSAGCFSMTDEQIGEIYAIMREAFAGGQKSVQMQSFPFRMNPDNLAKFRLDPNLPFWKELKKGADHFEVTKQEPAVGVCNRHYVFDSAPATPGARMEATAACPPLKMDEDLAQAVAQKQFNDEKQVAELVAKGEKPIRLVYQDGGQHPDFARKVADVSRPDALAGGPTEIILDEKQVSPVVKVAAAHEKTSVPVASTPAVVVAQSAPVSPKPATTTTVAAAYAPAATSTPANDDSSIYKKLIGSFGWLGGSKTPDAPAVTAPQPAPAATSPVTGKKAQAATSRPQASLDDALREIERKNGRPAVASLASPAR